MDVRKVCTTLHRARRDVEEYGAQRCIGHEGMWNEYGGDVRWEARGDHEMQHCATKKERNLFLKLPLFLDRGEGGRGGPVMCWRHCFYKSFVCCNLPTTGETSASKKDWCAGMVMENERGRVEGRQAWRLLLQVCGEQSKSHSTTSPLPSPPLPLKKVCTRGAAAARMHLLGT